MITQYQLKQTKGSWIGSVDTKIELPTKTYTKTPSTSPAAPFIRMKNQTPSIKYSQCLATGCNNKVKLMLLKYLRSGRFIIKFIKSPSICFNNMTVVIDVDSVGEKIVKKMFRCCMSPVEVVLLWKWSKTHLTMCEVYVCVSC